MRTQLKSNGKVKKQCVRIYAYTESGKRRERERKVGEWRSTYEVWYKVATSNHIERHTEVAVQEKKKKKRKRKKWVIVYKAKFKVNLISNMNLFSEWKDVHEYCFIFVQ